MFFSSLEYDKCSISTSHVKKPVHTAGGSKGGNIKARYCAIPVFGGDEVPAKSAATRCSTSQVNNFWSRNEYFY